MSVFTAADVSLAREMHILIEQAPEPERSITMTGPWTPGALDRLLADVQASPATAEIDRYLLARISENLAAAQLKLHGLRAHNNGLVADLAIARESNAQLAREREALTLENADLRRKLRAALASAREGWRVAAFCWLAAAALAAAVLAARWIR